MTDPITTAVQTFVENPWVLLLIALGGIFIVIGYSTSFFKYLYDYSQRHRVKAKQEYLAHCDSLLELFNLHGNRRGGIQLYGQALEVIFNTFPYKDQFLRHLFTGHNEVFVTMIAMINFDRQIRTADNPASQEQKQESSRIDAEFKKAFEIFIKEMDLTDKTFGGVCDDCKRNYEIAYKTQEMTDKLKSFTMPF